MLVRSSCGLVVAAAWLFAACSNTHTVASRTGAGSSAGEAGAADDENAGEGGTGSGGGAAGAGNAGEGAAVSIGGGGEGGSAGAPPVTCEPACEAGVACIAGECQQCSETIEQQLDALPLDFGRTVFVVDVTGDGQLDLAYCDQAGLRLEVATPQGFVARPAVAFPDAVNDVQIMAHADLDADGAEDLVVQIAKGRLRVFWGGAEPVLATTDLPVGGMAATGDFDDDDQLDVVIFHDRTLSVQWGRPNRTFEAGPDSAANESARRVVVADVDRDGKLDVTVGTASFLQTFSGDGAGKFTGLLANEPAAMLDFTLSDVDQDGKLDLVMSHSRVAGQEPYDTGQVSVVRDFRGYTGAGIGAYDAGDGARVVVVDLDGDGNRDIVATNTRHNSADVLLGVGDGSFRTRRAYGVGAYPESVDVADIDGDDALDLIAVGRARIIARARGPQRFPQRVYPQLEGPEQIVVQDVTDDGHPDVLTVNNGGNDLLLLAGTPSGELDQPERITHGPLISGGYSSPIVAADLDGDGRTDIAMLREKQLTLFTRNQSNHFEQTSSSPWSGYVTGLAAGDLNEDGRLDLVSIENRGGSLRVRLGLGGGEFGPSNATSVGEGPSDVQIDDVNRDGHLDVVVLASNEQEVVVLDGRGDGTFAPARSFVTNGSALKLRLGDLDQDGFDDVALMYPGKVSVMLSDGQGGFEPEVEYGTVSPNHSSGSSGPGTALADFDGDGRLDLAVGEESQGSGPIYSRLAILRGRGDGTFLEPVRYPTAVSPYALASADLNGDDKPELVVLSRFGNAVVVFANHSQCGD